MCKNGLISLHYNFYTHIERRQHSRLTRIAVRMLLAQLLYSAFSDESTSSHIHKHLIPYDTESVNNAQPNKAK